MNRVNVASWNLGWLCALSVIASGWTTLANGIYRNGAGARSMALGGAGVADPRDGLTAGAVNPAGFALTDRPELQIGGVYAIPKGRFSNRSNDEARLTSDWSGGFPEAAIAFPIRSPITLALSVSPEAALGADWDFLDAPGGLGGRTSYGVQRHHSEILALRTALSAGFELNERFAAGASLGWIYNRNTLEAPYIFQSHPLLRGFKTLLDLETEGHGVDGLFGVLYRPWESLSFGLSYRTAASLTSRGEAEGNAAAQLRDLGGPFLGVDPDFEYDAQVKNRFPQQISAGASWRVHPRVHALGQIDWVGWGAAFRKLPIKLTKGNNGDLNAFVGSSTLEDTVPLRWKDQFVYRAGLEFELAPDLYLRTGYAYGASPVPGSTLTPLTAVIQEHTLTTGVGWSWDRYTIDFAYQYSLPKRREVGTSRLQAGEYSSSRDELAIHWFGLTTGIRF